MKKLKEEKKDYYNLKKNLIKLEKKEKIIIIAKKFKGVIKNIGNRTPHNSKIANKKATSLSR